MKSKGIRTNIHAFTIVEFLVVISIIAMLAAMLLPPVKTCSTPGRRKMCTITMAAVSSALFQYHDKYQTFPPAYVADSEGKPLYSWRVLILPFLGYDDLYHRFQLDQPWDSDSNKTLLEAMPRDFRCQAAFAELGEATYMMIVGPDTLSNGPDSVAMKDITNDPSKTILFVETVKGVPWSAPIDIPLSHLDKGITTEESYIGSNHPGIAHAAFFDKSVRPLPDDIDPKTLKTAAIISGDGP